MRNPNQAQLSEMRQLWHDGRTPFAEYLTKESQEADSVLRDGDGPEHYRKQGEARLLAELIKHFSGASNARQVQKVPTI